MKGDFEQLLGRRITGVIGKIGQDPAWMVFLILDDGSTFELYGDGDVAGSGPKGWPVDDVRRYMPQKHTIVVDTQSKT